MELSFWLQKSEVRYFNILTTWSFTLSPSDSPHFNSPIIEMSVNECAILLDSTIRSLLRSSVQPMTLLLTICDHTNPFC